MQPDPSLYSRLRQRLFDQNQFSIKLGLDNMQRALAQAQHPESSFQTIIVAGTNGKGTTSSLLHSLLIRQGARTGLYTSPHLVDFTERFRVQSQPLPQSTILPLLAASLAVFGGDQALDPEIKTLGLQAAKKLGWDISPNPPTLTFFELTTLIALEAFRCAKVDVAVLEIGLGGRLDAVNAVEPILTLITTIAFDHQTYLGDSLTDIAGEKAAIMRSGVPCITIPQASEVETVLKSFAQEREATLIQADLLPDKTLPAWLQGAFAVNASLACAAMQHVPKPWRCDSISPDVLHGLRWPGRRDAYKTPDRQWWFDVAHNPAGVKTLMSFLDQGQARPTVGVLGVMRDKDLEGICRHLAGHKEIRWIATKAASPRALEAETLAAKLTEAGCQVMAVCSELSRALEVLEEEARGEETLCCGSVYLLGELLSLLEVSQQFFTLDREARLLSDL